MSDLALVTGARGFVGARVIEAVARRNLPIAAVSRAPGGEGLVGVRKIVCDLTQPSELSALIADVRPTHLIHCAWGMEHGAYWESPENILWRDVSEELFIRFFEGGGRNAIGVGTCAEYDWGEKGSGSWSEEREINPQTLYGRTKADLARKLMAHAEDSNARAVWARLFFLFGPVEDPRRLTPSIVNALDAGQRPTLENPNAIRDFCSTWRAGEALAQLALSQKAAGFFNIGSGDPMTIREFAALIATLKGRPDLAPTEERNPASEPEYIAANVRKLKEFFNPPPGAVFEDISRLIQDLGGQKEAPT